MSITKEDIMRIGMTSEPIEKQLELFDYWDEEHPHDPRLDTPTDMVKEYHKTAGLPYDVDYSKGDTSDLFRLRGKLISEEYEEAMGELYEGSEFGSEDVNPVNLLKELADLVYVVYATAVTFGWDLDEAVRRVHENNMGRMYQQDGSIKRREDGKVLKNKNYPKVNLEDLV